MSKENYLSANIFLSSLGIYLSYFYFGTRVYHYPLYELGEILVNGILLALLISLPIIFLNLFFKNFFKIFFLKKLYYSTLFGILIYLVYHYIIRFMDMNYYHIYISNFKSFNILFKVFFYLYPFILFTILSFFINEKSFKNLNIFFFILLIILNFLSINRTFEIYGKNERQAKSVNDFEYFKKKSEDKITSNKKIFFLIFDTFDQFYLEKNIDNLINLKKIYQSSYVNKNFFTPAKFTLDSVPAILTGNSTKKTVVTLDGLHFYNQDNKVIKFNHENSIFNQNKDNFTSSIFGFYHPYCRIFNVKYCYDTIDFVKKNINLGIALGIFFKVTYVEKFLNPLKMINKKKKSSSQKIENIDTNYLSKFMLKNSSSFINIDSNLIFIHYPYPHPPLKTQGILLDKKNNLNLSDYEKNLFLIDLTLSKIKSSLELYQNSLLIITSDHWFKEGHDVDKVYPSVFFSKIIGDDNYIEDSEAKNLSSIKKLINNYINDKINSNKDIKSFFNNEKNHNSYVR